MISNQWAHGGSAWVLAILSTVTTTTALAQGNPGAAYPTKSIRWIVPFPPGGSADVLARLAAPKLSEALGQQIIIDNRSGASGTIGTVAVARSAPDGYTLLSSTLPFVANPALHSKPPYDVVREFEPVMLMANQGSMIALHPSVPVKNVLELIALAKSRPGQINYATSSNGSPNNLAGELLNLMAGISLTHVAYKSTPQATTDVIGGHVHSAMASLTSVLPHVRTGKLKALGTTGPKRTALAPEVPAIAETVAGYQSAIWNGLIVPGATPRTIITRLNQVVVQQLKSPELRERFATLGAEILTSTPEEFDAFIRAEMVKWEKVIKASGMRVN